MRRCWRSSSAYYLRGLYVATAVLMVAMLLLLAVDWLRNRRIPTMHALSTVLVLIFGAATLLLHNKLFIQWKPTVFFWLASLAFLGSFWIGERTLTERLLGRRLGRQAARLGGALAHAELVVGRVLRLPGRARTSWS